MKESELYQPIQKYLLNLGFEVDGEVKTVDIVAIKDSSKIAIELKKVLNLKVIIQAAINQKYFDIVYVGIFSPKHIDKQFKDKLYILKRLGIGLILVNEISKDIIVYSNPIVIEITKYQKRNVKKSNAIILELSKRTIKNNVGGVSQTKILTAYRQNSLRVLYVLSLNHPNQAKNIKKEISVFTVNKILNNNYYDWFIKISRGVYDISEKGFQALTDNKDIISELMSKK